MNHIADIPGPNDSTIQIYEDTSGTRRRWHYEIWIDMFSDLASIPIDTHEKLLPQTLEEIARAIVGAYSYGMDTGSTNAKYIIRRALGIA